MTNQTSIERLVEEYKKRWARTSAIWSDDEAWLRSALSQARQEGREWAVEYIKSHKNCEKDELPDGSSLYVVADFVFDGALTTEVNTIHSK